MSAVCPKDTIDSNLVGLRFAFERCPGVLPSNPVWKALEPNSFADFGANYTSTARAPINRSRSRKKGTVTDMDANGGFNQDLTQSNSTELFQSFFFANARQRGSTDLLAYGDLPVTAVTVVDNDPDPDSNTYTFANLKVATLAIAVGGSGYKVGDLLTVSGGTATRPAVAYVKTVNGSGAVTAVVLDDPGIYSALPSNPAATTGGSGASCTLNLTSESITEFVEGELVFASGFANSGNNGIKTVVAMSGGVLEVVEAVTAETPPAGAKLETVGFQFGAGDVDIAMNGDLVRLTSSAIDFTDFNFIEGEWVFLGGDAGVSRFTNNVGYARIASIDAEYLEFDKVTWDEPGAESGSGLSIVMYFGTIIRNEPDPDLIINKTVQLERTLGNDLDGTMSEYLEGCTANEMTLNVGTAALCTVDMAFVAAKHEPRTGSEGLKSGSRPILFSEDGYNTVNHFRRIKMGALDPVTANPKPLFGHFTDCTLTINNNASPNKAIGILGALNINVGTFEVGGELTAYFMDMAGPKAIRNNASLTLDYIISGYNDRVGHVQGMLWDIPLLTLGGGVANVEPNQPITIPVETSAAESAFGHTLLFQSFSYLPQIAA